MSELLTTGDIARQLDVDRDKVTYAIRKLDIKPKQQAGILNLYTSEDVKPIREFIKERSEPEAEG